MPLLPGQSDVASVYISEPDIINEADCVAAVEVVDIAADVVKVPEAAEAVPAEEAEELADEIADLFHSDISIANA